MKTIKLLSLYAAIIVLLASGCSKGGKQISINSGATMGPLMVKLIEFYNTSTGNDLQVKENGSLKCLSLLIEGKNDIAVSSVKIPPAQLWEAQKRGISIKEIVVGYDIIIPIINRSNRIDNLFLGQLADIYSGLIKDWKDAGGKPGTITVVDRNDASGTKLVMDKTFFEIESVVEGCVKKNCDSDVIAYVSKHPGAVGYISQSFMNSSIKAININGANAMMENIENKSYPLCRELYIYVNDKAYTGVIKSFIEFVLNKSGQDILKQNGFIPLARLQRS